MSTHKLSGTGVALVTPFHKDGSIDFKGFRKLLEHIIGQNADYLVPLGTTGESVTLTVDEKTAVLDFVLEINDNRLPVVLGLGGNSTQEIVNCLRRMNLTGVEAILSVSPYYNKPSQKGIYQHYKQIANTSPVPIIVYNVPGRTASNILPETTLSLASDLENIIGIKEASGNMEQIMQIIREKPADFLVISGDDALTMPLMAVGADGVISVVANAYPGEFAAMVRYARQGKTESAKNIHYSLLEMIQLLFTEGNPSGIKALLSHLDICNEFTRLPITGVSKSLQNKLSSVADNMFITSNEKPVN
jgi:4-hydroxy-tetrahydrodipicolinate synthase